MLCFEIIFTISSIYIDDTQKKQTKTNFTMNKSIFMVLISASIIFADTAISQGVTNDSEHSVILVLNNDRPRNEQAEDALERIDIRLSKHQSQYNIVVHLYYDDSGERYIRVDFPDAIKKNYASNIYKSKSQIKSVIEDEIVRLATYDGDFHMPNDTYYYKQWNSRRIDADHAWEITQGAASVNIAIVDNGLAWDHPDLVYRVWQNMGEDADGDGKTIQYDNDSGRWIFDPNDLNGIDDDDQDGNSTTFIDDLIGWDFMQGDNNPITDINDKYKTSDDVWRWSDHGTKVAGAAIASMDNNMGNAGVAGQSSFTPIRVGFGQYGSTGNISAAVRYASRMGADVTNLSWAGVESCDVNGIGSAAEDANDKGNTVVWAAGNGIGDPPVQTNLDGYSNLCEDKVIIVTASYTPDDNVSPPYDQLRWPSNYGSKVTVTAPHWVWVPNYSDGLYYSNWSETNRHEFFTYGKGTATSSATPQVSGVIALMKSVQSGLSFQTISSTLRSTGEDISAANSLIAAADVPPMVNAYQAVCSVSSTSCAPERVSGLKIANYGSTGSSPQLEWEASQGYVSYYVVERRTTTVSGSTAYSQIGTSSSTTYTDYSASIGTKYDATEYEYQIKSVGTNGLVAVPSYSVSTWIDPYGGALIEEPHGETAMLSYSIRDVAPNPINQSGTFRFSTPEDADVHITVHDILGRELFSVVRSRVGAGEYQAELNGTELTSGVYMIRFVAKSQSGVYHSVTRFVVAH